jgi:hypothetical protein
VRRTVGSVILAQPAVYFFIVVEHPLPLSAARQYLFQFAADALELGWGQTPSNAYFSGGWRLRRGRCGTGKCRNDLGNKHILTCGLI